MISDLLGRLSFLLDQLVDGQDLGNGFYACFQGMTTQRWIIFGLAVVGVLLCLFLLLLNAAIEAALSTINRLRLHSMLERHERRVIVIEQLLNRPNQVLSALNTLNTICLVVATALTITGMHQFNLYGLEVTVLVLLLVFFTLLFIRTVPKGFALHNPEGIAVRFSSFVNIETAVMSPLVAVVNFGSNQVLKLAKRPPIPANTVVTEEELTLLANVAEEDSLIQADGREMIRSIFEFGDTIVREIMIPRPDISAVPVNSSLNEALDIIQKSGHSRLPVCNEDIDHIVGILYAKDLLRYLRHREEQASFDLQKLVRPAHYVPESKKVDELFAELQKKRVHITIIIDEYGGTAGLVTIEDLLEEIVGEIQDEYDLETSEFERVGEDEVLVDARLNLSDVNDFFNTNWESENVDTIGGLIYDRLGRIPVLGDSLTVNQNGEVIEESAIAGHSAPYFVISVLSVNGQRLKQLRLERKPLLEPTEAPSPTENTASTTSGSINQKRETKRQKEKDRENEKHEKEREREQDKSKTSGSPSISARFSGKDVGDDDLPVTS